MSERKFVTNVRHVVLPKDGEPGRIARFQIDIDCSAVQEYIYYADRDRLHNSIGEPWPAAVIGELMDVLMEWARAESTLAMLAEMSERRER